jgi:selenocysteine lyase/cysteine desulfurase
MPKLLYLDTARLGQMSPRARRASVDFARFASEFGGSLYLGDFLRYGVNSWPDGIRHTFLGLADWHGIGLLKANLRKLTQARPESDVLLTARSATLMKFASQLLYGPCRNILITDLTWPVYERILRREQQTSACRITKVPLRRVIFSKQISAATLVERIARAFTKNQCDGLFLPLIDNLGVQLPLARIVERICSENELRFVVVDGAQAIHHAPLALSADYCDFLLAGCHKWLQAFTPMGVGFFGHPRSCNYVRDSLTRLMNQGRIDDPLLSFSDELQSGRPSRFGETVAVSPMIAGNAAAVDATTELADSHAEAIAENRSTIMSAASDHGWKLWSPGGEFSTRILLLQSPHLDDCNLRPEDLRRRLHSKGVVATAYRNGFLRISTPTNPLEEDSAGLLHSAFAKWGVEIG